MALTIRYVTSGAGGGGTGTSWGDPFTWAEMMADHSIDKLYRIEAGTYSLTTTQAFNLSGAAATPLVFQGWDTTHSHPSRDFSASEAVTLDFTGQTSGFGINVLGSYNHFHGIRVVNAFSDGWYFTGDYHTMTLCEGSSNGGTGIRVDRYCQIVLCKANNNTLDGIDCGGLGSSVFMSSTEDNTNSGITLSNFGCVACLNFSRGNGNGVTTEANIQCGYGQSLILNTLDAPPTQTPNIYVASGSPLLLGNLLSNAYRAVTASAGQLNELYTNRYNHTVADSLTDTIMSDQTTSVDPNYTNIATGDFSIGESTLQHIITLLGMDLSVGAWQGAAAAAGGGLLIHPGMAGGLRG